MKFGLQDTDLQSVITIAEKFRNVEQVKLFGSRAMGTHRAGSDIDLAVFGGELTFNEFLEVKIALEELGMLEQMDVVRFESIDNPELIDHINRVGIKIFSKV